ncbi:MAG: CoA-binding protein [Bacteroidota bacterium]
MKKTLIIGASVNPSRYAYKAASKLVNNGFSICLLGSRVGELCGEKIHDTLFEFKNVHTVTMYIRPELQTIYYNYIISLKPARVIFNPGTENVDFYELLLQNNILVEEQCTLVMLAMGIY